jgi:hypothetical protein
VYRISVGKPFGRRRDGKSELTRNCTIIYGKINPEARERDVRKNRRVGDHVV